MCPVIAIILLSSAPDSAATVAKPDLKLWPEKFLFSIPANSKESLIINATDWSVSLCEVSFELFANLLNTGPVFILEKLIQFFKLVTGQYFSLEKYGNPFIKPSPNWSVLDLLSVIFTPSSTKSRSSKSIEINSALLNPPPKPTSINVLFLNFLAVLRTLSGYECL